MTLVITVFWDVTPWSLVHRFLQNVGIHQATLLPIPEDSLLDNSAVLLVPMKEIALEIGS
jgi:hypothetical protein